MLQDNFARLRDQAPLEQVPVLCVGQLLQLRSEVSKFMRFVVSDKDAEQLAALQVPHQSVSMCLYALTVLECSALHVVLTHHAWF